MEFDEALISVWKQALVDKLSSVEVDHKKCPVRTTAKRKLKQIDLSSTDEIFAAWSRIQIRNPVGLKQREMARRSCSFWKLQIHCRGCGRRSENLQMM